MPETDVKTDDLPQDLLEQLGKLNKQLGEMDDLEEKIRAGEKARKAVGELKQKFNDRAQEVSDLRDEIEAKAKELHERQDEFEANHDKDPRSKNNFSVPGRLLKERVEENASRREQGRWRVEFDKWGLGFGERKTVTSASGSGGPLTDEDRVADIIAPGQRTLRIRDLLPVGQTTENTVEFVQENTVTDAAAPQDETASPPSKGESDFTFTATTETVRTIAHWVKVSTQMLDDVAQLQSYINTRMRFLLLQEEEDQLLLGDNTGQNLNGLQTQATAFDTAPFTNWTGSDKQQIDRLRFAIRQVQLSEFAPTGMVLHPDDWTKIELQKDGNNNYLFTDPVTGAMPRLWGLPVVSTTAQNDNEFLVGAFSLAAQIWDREQASVQISTEDDKNFQENLATMRAEERVALTVYRTASIVTGSFSET